MGAAEGQRQPRMPQLPLVGCDGPAPSRRARAAEIHTRYLLSGEATCIDCHKGIAHELPNMEGVDPGWKVPPELQGEQLPQSSVFDALGHFAAVHEGVGTHIAG